MHSIKENKWIFTILLLATASIFLEYGISPNKFIKIAIHILDFSVLILFITEIILLFITTKYRTIFFKKHWFDILFLIFFTILFIYSKYHSFLLEYNKIEQLSIKVILARNIFLALKIFGRFNKLKFFFKRFTTNPAQTMVISFLTLILTGTILLMLSFATANGTSMGFINALFTATSAVCVTGLIVVDTATYFSLYGKIIIMVLIQLGGLGIMTFTYCTAYILGRRISLMEKLALSYMLDENDMQVLSKSIIKIIFTTFLIESIGIILLFSSFYKEFGFTLNNLFYSAFHSISAFCNAGFALFSDSLVQFHSNTLLILTISFLIILGGISFPVIMNLYQYFKTRIINKLSGKQSLKTALLMNTKAVLTITLLLLISGTFIFYGFEHKEHLIEYNLKNQYLGAFFQSVTLRTAGFNSVNISSLNIPTYIFMLLFMFIGAAAGSTAGGIKVNTLAVIYAYIKSIFKNHYSVILYDHFLPKYVVSKALLIVILAAMAIFTGTFFLTVCEDFDFMKILFEVVSAFGTVGLSTGITPYLSKFGKAIIIITMFFGRLGPLTILAAIATKKKYIAKYPEGYINIG